MRHNYDRYGTRQLGLITIDQMKGLGLSARQIKRRSAQRVIVLLRPLVYRLAGAPIGWEQAVLAVVLATRIPSVISHTTAAVLWRLLHSDQHSAGMHVTAPRLVRLKGVTCHQGRISPDECTRHRGIPVTTPERTIIDLAASLTVTQLGECVDDALRRNLIRLARLRKLVDRAAASGHGRRLLRPLQKVLADRMPGYRPDASELERRMNAEWNRLGLPAGRKEYPVRCGTRTYRIDLALPEIKAGIEWDSQSYHGTRSGLDYDSDRRADLAAEGWVILGFTWNTSPERMARAVHRLWRDRGGPPIPAPSSG